MRQQPSWYRVQSAPGCPICGSEGDYFARGCRDAFPDPIPVTCDYRACRQCGSVWMDPRPAAETIPQLYRSYYTHARPSLPFAVPVGVRFARLRRDIVRGLLERCYGYGNITGMPVRGVRLLCRLMGKLRWAQRTAGRVVCYLPHQTGRLLDVGCGNGEFLALMKSLGWQVIGVEPDPKAAAIARSLGIEVICGRVEDSLEKIGQVDAITISHVLEHLPDPKAAVRKVATLLTHNGLLVAISPNPVGAIARTFGGSWYALDPPRHIVLPSPKGYAALFGGIGMNCEVFTTLRGAPGSVRESLSIRKTGTLVADQRWLVAKLIAYLVLPVLHVVMRDSGEEVVCIARRSA